MAITNYLRLAWIKHLLANSGGSAYSWTGGTYLELSSTSDYAADGTGGTPMSGYDPTPFTWDPAITHENDLPVPSPLGATISGLATLNYYGDTATVNGTAIRDAATGGNLLVYQNAGGGGGPAIHYGDQRTFASTITPQGAVASPFWHPDDIRRMLDLTFRGVSWTPNALDWVLYYDLDHLPPGTPDRVNCLFHQRWRESNAGGYSRLSCGGPWTDYPVSGSASQLVYSSDQTWYTWDGTNDTDGGSGGWLGMADGSTLKAMWWSGAQAPVPAGASAAGNVVTLRGFFNGGTGNILDDGGLFAAISS